MKEVLNKQNFLFIFVFLLVFSMESAFAAGGTGSVNTFLETVATILKSVGLITITIAIMVAGYKIAFGGSTFREVGPVLIGGAFVGSASWLAGQLMGSS